MFRHGGEKEKCNINLSFTYALVQYALGLGYKGRLTVSVSDAAGCEVNVACLFKTWIKATGSPGWYS